MQLGVPALDPHCKEHSIPEVQEGGTEQVTHRANVRSHADALRGQDQCQEAEKVAHHLHHWNTLAEQIPMTIQLPVSQVEAVGIENASKQRGDWHQQD